ncbi:related to ser thr protein kinase [Ceraceosorus bombacis]|uniref:Related to ser thr protein kinase n=1 Tax=Ceraceosorus bombacis TaxID=401625 RepID=A0A0P1BLD8_9BASI|nr:related to ser thr protein kinase [Ceraceosorus bombacis]
MRYSSDLQVPRSAVPLGQQDLVSDRSPTLTAAPLSAQPSRSRYDSEMGSMYSNTVASYSTEDALSMPGIGSRLSREASVAPATKHKLVVTEAGKPNVSYQLGNCIGRGQFGSVYRALNLNSGQMMAVKRIKLAGKTEDEVMQLMNEVDLLKSLAHPSVVKYEGLVRGDDVLSIILEYVENGSLLHTLKAFGNFPEKLVASYVVKILEGLNYLHEMKVVHCDLKAANILTTKNGNVKLSDFGVSLNLKAVEAIKNVKNDAIGTPNWMAPEVIELKGASTSADIWSLGCTIIELLTGKPPYGDMLAIHIVRNTAADRSWQVNVITASRYSVQA